MQTRLSTNRAHIKGRQSIDVCLSIFFIHMTFYLAITDTLNIYPSCGRYPMSYIFHC